MKFDFKGKNQEEGDFSDFVNYFNLIADDVLWTYQGLSVELDPTADYNNKNILIRWTDINEGFNDKIIYYNLAEFKKDFRINYA
jgi:hypothetical protein